MSIPDSNGVIHAVYQTPPPRHGANLAVIDTATGGLPDDAQVAITWNQTGPEGPQGPQGDVGPAGSSGISGYEVITSEPVVPDSSGWDGSPTAVSVTAYCPAGKHVLGGGFTHSRDYSTAHTDIWYNGPVNNNAAWMVAVDVSAPAGTEYSLQAFVICATVS